MTNPILPKPYKKCSECNRKLNNVWVKIVRQDKKKLTSCCFYSILSIYKLVETDKLLNLGGFRKPNTLTELMKELYSDEINVALYANNPFLKQYLKK